MRNNGDDSMNDEQSLKEVSPAASPLSGHMKTRNIKHEEYKDKMKETIYLHEDKKKSDRGKEKQFILVDTTLPIPLQIPIDTDFLNRLCDTQIGLIELKKLLLKFVFNIKCRQSQSH
jgi:hypothetical protein